MLEKLLDKIKGVNPQEPIKDINWQMDQLIEINKGFYNLSERINKFHVRKLHFIKKGKKFKIGGFNIKEAKEPLVITVRENPLTHGISYFVKDVGRVAFYGNNKDISNASLKLITSQKNMLKLIKDSQEFLLNAEISISTPQNRKKEFKESLSVKNKTIGASMVKRRNKVKRKNLLVLRKNSPRFNSTTPRKRTNDI